jgi:hypothetical protein
MMDADYDTWTPDLSRTKDLSLPDLAELALFAGAGQSAVRLVGNRTAPIGLRRELARQGLAAIFYISTPGACESILAEIAKGGKPFGNLAGVASVMRRMEQALSAELRRREREYDNARGVRDL